MIGKITPPVVRSPPTTPISTATCASRSRVPACAALGTAGCGNSVASLDPAAGAQFQQTPEAFGQPVHDLGEFPFGLTLGYSLTYQGSFALNLPALATPTTLTQVFKSDDYLVHSWHYVAYAFTDKLKAQVNEEFHRRAVFHPRPQQWLVDLGDARAAIFSLSYQHRPWPGAAAPASAPAIDCGINLR